jgi:hypothetical protein
MRNKSVFIPARLALSAILLILAGCVSLRPDLILADLVGPPGGLAGQPSENGKLVVYTAIEPTTFVENPFFYHRAFYVIYDAKGGILRQVPSSKDDLFPPPAPVELPPGGYRIAGKAAKYGLVSVPVVIKGGQTTPVYLDGQSHPEIQSTDPRRAVTLPKGEFVGWKAGP